MKPCPKPVKREPKARKPLKRTWMRPSKRGTKHSRRPRNIDYMVFVKTLPCLAYGMPGGGACTPDEDGHVEAAHIGEKVGYRAVDMDCAPLCSKHHRTDGFDSYSGPFKSWSKLERFAWAVLAIEWTRRAWEAR